MIPNHSLPGLFFLCEMLLTFNDTYKTFYLTWYSLFNSIDVTKDTGIAPLDLWMAMCGLWLICDIHALIPSPCPSMIPKLLHPAGFTKKDQLRAICLRCSNSYVCMCGNVIHGKKKFIFLAIDKRLVHSRIWTPNRLVFLNLGHRPLPHRPTHIATSRFLAVGIRRLVVSLAQGASPICGHLDGQ